ncbi:MAG: hybrid sensor histidine kinase/response regulator [Myxococcota bacterium]
MTKPPRTDFRDALILYVDDDYANRTSFQYVFEERFRFALAASGAEALELIDQEVPAVLLADHRMPGMTGVELCEAVREKQPGIIRMILTAYADLDAVTDAINRGSVHRYLRKPYDDDELLQALSSGVTLWRERREIAVLETRLFNEAPAHVARMTEVRIWHELKNLLAPLYTHIQLLEESLPPTRDETRAIVQDLYGIHKNLHGYAERLRTEPVEEQCAGADVVEQTIRLFQRDHIRPLIQAQIDARPRLPIGTVPLTQVLYNLFKNAERFGATEVSIRTFVEGESSIIEISDNGPGISAEVAERIFEDRFTTHEEGHGLGLAISRQLVEQGDGELLLEPSSSGACFRLRFRSL